MKGTGFLFDPVPIVRSPIARLIGVADAASTYESYQPEWFQQYFARFPVRDQAGTSACVAFARLRAIHMAAFGRGSVLPYPSELAAYAGYRMQAGQRGDELIDSGSYPAAAAQYERDRGLVAENAWPWMPSIVNCEPDWATEAETIDHALTGEYEPSDGPSRNAELATAIRQGHNPVIAVRADKAFFETDGFHEIPPDDGTGSWHAIPLVGFARVGDRFSFITTNSWGIGWGNLGFAWLSHERVAQSPFAQVITGGPKGGL